MAKWIKEIIISYFDELKNLGSSLSMSPAAVEERILYVSAAIMESYVEMALEVSFAHRD